MTQTQKQPQIPASFERAVALLIPISHPSFPFEISNVVQNLVIPQLVGDLFGRSIDEVNDAVRRGYHFSVRSGKILFHSLVNGEPVEVLVGRTYPDDGIALIADHPAIINESNVRVDLVTPQALIDCRAWLESKGYQLPAARE